MSFSEQLAEHRKRLGLTQAQIAAVLDVSPRIVWDWEHGTKVPLEVTQEGVLARLSLLSSSDNQ